VIRNCDTKTFRSDRPKRHINERSIVFQICTLGTRVIIQWVMGVHGKILPLIVKLPSYPKMFNTKRINNKSIKTELYFNENSKLCNRTRYT